MMSSTKSEVHNVSQWRRRRTEPRPSATCTKNLVKIACVVSKISSLTDRHTHIHTHTTDTQAYSSQYFANAPVGEVKMALAKSAPRADMRPIYTIQQLTTQYFNWHSHLLVLIINFLLAFLVIDKAGWWRSGNGVGRINEVTLHRAHLVGYWDGWRVRVRFPEATLYFVI